MDSVKEIRNQEQQIIILQIFNENFLNFFNDID